MANNRLYLKCKCGKKLFLGKHYGDGWFLYDSDKRFSDVINSWHNEHNGCFYRWNDNPYSIVTENDDESNSSV